MFESLPIEILLFILSKVDHHAVYLINQICHYTNNIYKSQHFRDMITMKINQKMQLKYNEYRLPQLMNIFLSLKRKHLFKEFMLNDKGKVYRFDNEVCKIEPIPDLNNIIDIDPGGLFLNTEGHAYYFTDFPQITKSPIENVKRLLGDNLFLNANDEIHRVIQDVFYHIHLSIDKRKRNDYISCNTLNLNENGMLYDGNGARIGTQYYIQVEHSFLLSDTGNISMNDLISITNDNNIIAIVKHAFGTCFLLDNKGNFYHYDGQDIKCILESNIIEISVVGYRRLLALDIGGKLYIIWMQNGKWKTVPLNFNLYES